MTGMHRRAPPGTVWKSATFLALVLCFFLVLTGCGGTKVLKESQPIESPERIATSSDASVTLTLDWIIVRDGPGTWSRNANWDEYLLTVINHSDKQLQVTGLTVTDALDVRIDPQVDRTSLIKASKDTLRRYRKSDVVVVAGHNTTGSSGAGLVTAGAVAAGTAGAAAGAGTIAGAGAGAAAAAGVVLVPALAIGGVARIVNNSAVDKEIGRRQTSFPMALPPGGEATLDVFFPVAPSPRLVELEYVDLDGEHSIAIDTRQILRGLHVPHIEHLSRINR